MTWIFTKYLITALMVILVSEAAKHSDRIGGLIAALPLVTVTFRISTIGSPGIRDRIFQGI